jgi:hypothetical protein
MTWFLITLPLMIVAVAIATVPVLYHSIREHRQLHDGVAPRRSHRDAQGAAYWTRPGRRRAVRTHQERGVAA